MTARIVALALAASLSLAGSVTALADDDDSQDASKAIAQLYELQAAFHEAAAGAGVDATTKAEHLNQMLELFTDDAVLIVGSTVYVGRGDVNTTCVPGSLTICDFFQNHAGSFVLGRNWAALRHLRALISRFTGTGPTSTSSVTTSTWRRPQRCRTFRSDCSGSPARVRRAK